jgi:hypothetical protein
MEWLGATAQWREVIMASSTRSQPPDQIGMPQDVGAMDRIFHANVQFSSAGKRSCECFWRSPRAE